MAEIRVRHLKRRLERDKDLHEKYHSVIDGYIAKGHAGKLTKEDAEPSSNKTWYLLHHSVTSPNKPGKIRVVFDAAAKFQGTSLNDQLLPGPDYINKLAGILMRFCQEEAVLIADIEQMFHKVRVPAEDCYALRFLWWSGTLNDEPEEFQTRSTHLVPLLPLVASIKLCDKPLMIMRTSMAAKLQKMAAIIFMSTTSSSLF